MKLNQGNFTKSFNKKYFFEKKPSIAVGVSGGPDSMGLLFLLNKWNKSVNGNLTALIVNHNLRLNSFEESKSVYMYLKNQKIKTKILSVKKNQVIKRSMSEARENRYKLLTDYCKKNNILHLFLGHHKDDNLETFLLRKVSGSDFDGLGSIKLISLINQINIIRPLLFFSKQEIIDYNLKNKIPFIKDPSNNNLSYTRPSIRNYINEISKKNYIQVCTEFKTIQKNLKLYKIMVSEILIKNIIYCNKNHIEINLNNFLKLDTLVSEKIIKKLYAFFNQKEFFLRSKKIQIFINELKNKNFKTFNLRGMTIKKVNKTLIFFNKTN